ncbi:MAG: DUF47 family protein [Clostridia bacterium]|nr:DUF47 family protein [Clostridia bacterium]
MNKKENYDYFNEFIEMTDCIVKSAYNLKSILENFDINKLNTDINVVHNLENQADQIIHKMRNYLIKDFLPPIDREDIALIGNKLDNIEDGIDEALINIKILGITEIKKEVIELVNILVICCEAVREAFLDFKKFKKTDLIEQKVIQINKWEEQGDRIYEKLMTSLYKNEKNPINLIKWNNIYNCLEETIDNCEEVGDCLEDIVMKNS